MDKMELDGVQRGSWGRPRQKRDIASHHINGLGLSLRFKAFNGSVAPLLLEANVMKVFRIFYYCYLALW